MESQNPPTITYNKSIGNIGVSFEPVCIAKSLNEGVADLVRTAQEEKQEACWLYVHDDRKWYNLSGERINELREDGLLMEGIVMHAPPEHVKGKAKSHFHTHPKAFMDREADIALKNILTISRDIPGKAVEELKRILKKAAYVIEGLPSSGDIETYLDLALEGEDNQTDFFVVSPLFVSQVRIDPYRAEELVNILASEKYEELQKKEALLDERHMTAYRFYPVINLAENLCRRINEEIPGIEIKLKAHPGGLAYLL
ncbi:MAG: hypothetical protein KJ955_02375 [Nanoarchaeota archaeon]|nr:hypothetical protein [Nanoarchaeota archaeon]